MKSHLKQIQVGKILGERKFFWPPDRAQLLAMPDPWILGIFFLGIGHDASMEYTNEHSLEDFNLAHISWGPKMRLE